MKRLIVFLLAALFLFGCTPQASSPPSPDDRDKPTALTPLPVTDGINWNEPAAKGNVKREFDPDPVYYIESISFPSDDNSIQITDDISIYKPLFASIIDENTRSELNRQVDMCISSFKEELEKAQAIECPPEEGITYEMYGWGGCYAYMTGSYINIFFEYNYSFEKVKIEPDETITFINAITSGYNRDVMCFDAATGKLLTLEDIFYDDMDFGTILSRLISSQLMEEYGGAKRPFRGLPKNWSSFYINTDGSLTIAFPEKNPYADYAIQFNIPLWDLRRCIKMDPLDITLTDIDYKQEEPWLCYLQNTDLDIGVERHDYGNILRLVPLKETPFDIDGINAQIDKLYEDFIASLPFDLRDTEHSVSLDSQLYATVNLISISISASYLEGPLHSWNVVETGALFDLVTGERLKAGDGLFINENTEEIVEHYIPKNAAELTTFTVFPFNSAILYFDNTSVYFPTQTIKDTIWRNIG